MPGIGVILNRNAGKKRTRKRGHIGEKLGFVLGDPSSMHETSRIEEIEQVARTFLDRGIDILGISGGDGSNHYTLDTFLRVYGDKPLPRVALLCGGTHNAHAASIDVSGSPEELLQHIVRKYHTGDPFQTTHRVLIKIDDGLRAHFGFTMATGFMYRFYKEMVTGRGDSVLGAAGLLSAWTGSALVGGRRIRELFRKEPARITVGDTLLDWAETNGVSASSMERLGLGFIPWSRASETPTTFHMTAFCMSRPASFLWLLSDYKRGRVPGHPETHSDIADRVVLETGQPIGYVFDGELFTGSPRLEITSGPRIELIVS